MTKDEALKMAIEALQNIDNWLPTIGQRGLRDYEADALDACKKALEQPTVAELNDEYLRDTYVEGLNQPAQEPVASLLVNDGEPWRCAFNDEVTIKNSNGSMFDGVLPLYTHPHQWQGLTEDEIKDIQDNSWIIHSDEHKEFNTFKYARAIEQALMEKNT